MQRIAYYSALTDLIVIFVISFIEGKRKVNYGKEGTLAH